MADESSLSNLFSQDVASIDVSLIIPGVILVLLIILFAFDIRSAVIEHRTSSKAAFSLVKAEKRAKKRNRFLTAVYHTALKIPGINKYLKTVELSYLQICPYDDARLMWLTSETLAIAFLVSGVGIVAIFALSLFVTGGITLFSIASAVLIVYILSVETAHRRIREKSKKLDEEFVHYFARVKHKYLAKPNIPQAVIDAADGMSPEINLHAMKIHDILSGTERKERVREYALNPFTNQYMKLFISQVYEASEQGDTLEKDTDTSLFSSNLEFLRVEIMRSSCRKETRDFKFQGYSLITCVPVFFMSLLRKWGMDFSVEMITFYEGTGHLVVFLAFLATVLVYDNVNKAKEVSLVNINKDIDFFDRLPQKNPIRKLMAFMEERKNPGFEKIRSMLLETGDNRTLGAFMARIATCVCFGILIGVVLFSSFHMREKKRILADVANIDSVVYIVSDTQKEVIAGHILDMTREYMDKTDLTVEELSFDFQQRMFLPNTESVKNICNEVIRRIGAYNQEYFRWYEFVFSLLFGAVAALIPYASLKYRYGIVQAGRDDEVRQFQSIIIMERSFPDVTIQQILEDMETFAHVFKRSIRECINSYSAGPVEALEKLRDDESDCPEFVEIVDGFLAVETVGVRKAFAEVQNNREMSETSRALYEDILLKKKTDFTEIIAYVPAAIVVGGYFIGPFCYHVFGSVMDVFDMLETFSTF